MPADKTIGAGFLDKQLNSPGPFDRDLKAKDVMEIQIEIAKKVVAAIGSLRRLRKTRPQRR